jgi:hypothetical protein
MTQGAPMLAGMDNTASKTTHITLTGPDWVGLDVSATAPFGSTTTPWAGIQVGAFNPGAEGIYSIGRGRGVYAVGLDMEGVRAHSVSSHGLSGTTLNPFAAGVVGTSETGIGVLGRSGSNRGFNAGVVGTASNEGIGVLGQSTGGTGVRGMTGGSGEIAIIGDYQGDNPDGTAVAALGNAGLGLHASGRRAAIRLVPSFGITGPPTTGSHSMGELVVDQKGDLFLCKQDGTPGTWVRVA